MQEPEFRKYYFEKHNVVMEKGQKFRAIGALDLLAERNGENYVLEVLGLRKPRGIVENLRFLKNREYPRREGHE